MASGAGAHAQAGALQEGAAVHGLAELARGAPVKATRAGGGGRGFLVNILASSQIRVAVVIAHVLAHVWSATCGALPRPPWR